MYISEEFIYCPRCSAKFEKLLDRLQCPDCGLHYYVNPKPCTSLLLQNQAREYLLTERARDPQKGLFDLPGGFVDDGEDFEAGMRREIREELGFDLKGELAYVSSFYDTYDYQNVTYPTLAVTFHTTLPGGVALRPDDDVASYQFFKLEDIPYEKLAFPSIKRNFELLKNIASV